MTEWKDKYDPKQLDDGCYPSVFLDFEVTHEQVKSLFRKWKQDDQGLSWTEFAHTAQPTIGCDGAIVVPWCNMYLCIEKDGYIHS